MFSPDLDSLRERLWNRVRRVWHRLWVNPESERPRISQIDWQRPGGADD